MTRLFTSRVYSTAEGFQLTFANGYTISVQFGPFNYCNHHRNWGAETAEVKIIDPEGKSVALGADSGYQSADQVAEWLAVAKGMKAGDE